MALSSVTNRVGYLGNGTSAVFNWGFRVDSPTDLGVFVYNSSATSTALITPQVLNTDYTFVGDISASNVYPNGGNIIFNSTPNPQAAIVIFRSSVVTNDFLVGQFGSIPSTSLNNTIDRLTMIAQRAQDIGTRSTRLPDGFPYVFDTSLPNNIAQSAGKRLIVNSSATGWTFDETLGQYIPNTLIYATTNSSITSLGGAAPGQILISNGSSAPTWGPLFSGSSAFSGILSVANGGTGTGSTFQEGTIVFVSGSGGIYTSSANLFWSSSNRRLGLSTASPSSDISFGGDTSRNIAVERSSVDGGNTLTVQAGGGLSGATDANGGNLLLKAGISTGAGSSNITFFTGQSQGISGTSDNNPGQRMIITGDGRLGVGVANPTAFFQLAGGNKSGASTNNGSQFEIGGGTFTDTSTADGGTASQFNGTRFNSPVLAAINSGVITTTAATFRIGGAASAGANQNITNSYALLIPGVSVDGSVTNAYGLRVEMPSGTPTNKYTATFEPGVGFGGVTDPQGAVEIAASTRVVNSSEQLILRSTRAQVSAGDMIAGIAFKSNDSTLTAPGLKVCLIDAVATATHNLSVLTTDLVFYTTQAAQMSESMRITGAGNIVVGATSGSNLFQVGSTAAFNVNNLGRMVCASAFVTGLATDGYLKTSGTSGLIIVGSAVLTNPMTTIGDIIYGAASGAATRLAAGAPGTILTSNGSSAPSWNVNSLTPVSPRRVTTAGSATIADETIILSDPTHPLGLFSTSGNAGRKLSIMHAGSSLTQTYLLSPASSTQLVGGYSSYTLFTRGEVVNIQVNDTGTEFLILDHKAETDWVLVGSTTIGATTTPPTKSTGIAIDEIWWRRIGNSAEIKFDYRQSTATSAAAGSGDYLFGMPPNIAIDTSVLTVYQTVEGNGQYVTMNMFGSAFFANTTNTNTGFACVYDSTQVRLFATGGASGAAASDNINIAGAGINYHAIFTVPIAGWRP